MPNEYEKCCACWVLLTASGDRVDASRMLHPWPPEAAPNNARGWYDLGTAHYNLGNNRMGEQHRQKAEMDPSPA